MTTSFLEYELQDGFVHNWLVAGPASTPLDESELADAGDEAERKLAIARARRSPDPGIGGEPVEWGKATVDADGEALRWTYVRCLEDHFVDLSTFHHRWTYLRAWAYTRLDLLDGGDIRFELTTNGPADVWIDGHHVHRQEHFAHQDPRRVTFTAPLEAGEHEVLVRFEEVAARECPYVMALRVLEGVDPEDVEVRIPTLTDRVARHQMFEHVFPQACVERPVYFKGRHVMLRWSEDLDTRFHYQYSVQDQRNRIHISGEVEAEPGAAVDVGHDFRIWQGKYRVVLRPPAEEYYPPNNVRYQWDMPFYILDTAYSETPYDDYASRNREALRYATTQPDNLYAEIAKFELRQWEDVNLDVVQRAIERVNLREDCADFDLVGLLGVLHRYAGEEGFPDSLREPLRECVLNFRYWYDEPGTDAMCFGTENHSILFHTCEILAGQLYPDAVFTNNGETGRWHREKGERLALAWLQRRGATGFWEWDSNCYFDEDLLALSHLAGLAENEEIAALASVVIDKMLFTMAVNSYKGVFGSTHGRSYAPFLISGQLEPTSGICRLMWGQGVYNQHLRGLVGMACSEYEFPLMIARIATQIPEEMWDRERHVINEAGEEVNKVTYKTPDYMLASAQDYHPGKKGYQEHIWQATLGPDAVVFVNHPSCMSEGNDHRPNVWSGNYRLPRVAQWKDVLLALYQLSEDDWMGFTHAYFPVFSFDEYALRGHWAFARVGEGYLALGASQRLRLVRRGPYAYRELRCPGPASVWVCHMGRAAVDGDFDAFQRKIMALPLTIEGLSVAFKTLRGDELRFDWEGPLLRNGVEEPITGFRHYDNPYCVVDMPAKQMDIQFGGTVMRLEF